MSMNQETLNHIKELRDILKKTFKNNPQTRRIKNYKDEASLQKNILKRIQAQNLMIFRNLGKKMIIKLIQQEKNEFLKSLDDMHYDDQTLQHYNLQTNQEPFNEAYLGQDHPNQGNNPPPLKKQTNSRSRKLSHQVSQTKTRARPESIQVKDINFKNNSDHTMRRSESMDSPRFKKRPRTQDNYQQQQQVRSQKKCKKQQKNDFSNTIKLKQVQKDNGLTKKTQTSSLNQKACLKQNKQNRQNKSSQNEKVSNAIQEKTQNGNQVSSKKLSENVPFTVHENCAKQDEIELPVFQSNIQRIVCNQSAFQGNESMLPDNQPVENASMNEQVQWINDEHEIAQTLSEVPPLERSQEEQNPYNQNQNPFLLNQPYSFLGSQENRCKYVLRIKLQKQLRDFKYHHKRHQNQRPKSLQKITNYLATYQIRPQTTSPKQRLKTEKFSIGNLQVKLSIDSNERLIPQYIEFITKRNGLKFETTDRLKKLTKNLKDVTGMKPAARKYRYEQLYKQFRLI